MPKIITREHLIETIKRTDSFWSVPDPYVWRYDTTKRKMYLLICKCGSRKWIHWRKLRAGESTGCRSCARKTHGMRYDPLYLSWHGLKKKGKPFVEEWSKDFVEFEKWARALYAPGWKLIRIDKTLPYGPDNCDYVPVRRKKLEVVCGDMLPIGVKQKKVA